MTRRRIAGAMLAAALLLGSVADAAAQEAFPSRAVRLIVPFSAGGTADVLSRFLAQRLTPLWGQQVVVENKPGAGGHIGADAAAKSPADGYTLVLGTIGIHAAASLYRKLPYDPAKDLQPITVLAALPNVVIVHPALPVATLTEFIAYAKANPGKVNFGSAGPGTSTHMAGELFRIAAGIELTHVPYRGSAPALNDLIAGQIQAMFENLPTTPPHIRSGAVRALAVTSRTRSPSLPDVPSIVEAGLPAGESTAWFTIATAAGLPPAVLQKLNADITGLIRQPEMAAQIRELGADPVGNSPQEAAAFFETERVKWTEVIRVSGVTID